MSIDDILTRLRAADRALALVRGGTSELEQLRVATGELLVAVHGLAGLQSAGAPRAGEDLREGEVRWESEAPAEPSSVPSPAPLAPGARPAEGGSAGASPSQRTAAPHTRTGARRVHGTP
jgi:hypothetical protein